MILFISVVDMTGSASQSDLRKKKSCINKNESSK